MSGGGGANPTGGQYPAPVVSGLWGQANQGFQPFPYPGTAGAANQALGGIGSGFYGSGNQTMTGGPTTQSLGAGNWNPYMQGYQGANALNAGGGFLGTANQQQQQVNPLINQTLQTGFDPQQKLFNQLFNQQQQQGLAGQAAAGVANTPYGAGLSEQGNQNFDIAWQNAQLARQGQAAQNAQALEGIPGIAANTAEGMLGTGANLGLGAGNFLNNINQQQIQDYLSYLGLNTSNSAQLMNAINQSLNAGTSLFGAQTGANAQNQQLLNAGLTGLGALGGTALGSFIPGIGNIVGGGLGASLGTAIGGGV